MFYDATRDALYRPCLQPPLDPALFAGKPDARCAELARLAYFPFPPEANALPGALVALGFARDSLLFLSDNSCGTEALAALDGDGVAHVAFRGTESRGLTDMITDAAILPTRLASGAWVHRGFANAHDSAGSVATWRADGSPGIGHRRGLSIRAALAVWLDGPGRARHGLVATGHSLGAALATLFAADHAEAELVTFGSPAVGFGAFATGFAGRTVRRYRDCSDIVTTVPPPWLAYRHVSEASYIDRDGRLHARVPDTAAMRRDAALAAAAYLPVALARWGTVKARRFADHAPINYVSALLGLRRPLAEGVIVQSAMAGRGAVVIRP